MAKRITKTYDQEFKSPAVKLAQEIGGHKAAEELGVPSGTIYAWVKAFKEGHLEAKAALSILQAMLYPLMKSLWSLESILKSRIKKSDA